MSIMDTLKNATGIATLLKAAGASSEDAKAAAEVLADMEVGKAVSQELTSGEHVKDRWNSGEGHKTPTREEIKTGSPQHSSGGGAEKMVREYSNPAPQDHLTASVERLSNEMGQLRGYAKATAEAVQAQGKAVNALTGVVTAVLGKSVEEGTPGAADPTEAQRFGEFHVRKAGQMLRATKAVLLKASQLRDGLDDLEGDARKAAKAQLGDLRKKAARLGLDTLAATYAAKSEEADPALEIRRSLHELMDGHSTLKADMSHLHDKDKEKDEEKRTKKSIRKIARKAAAKAAKKAAEKAAKAAAAAAGKSGEGAGTGEAAKTQMQADHQEKDNKNQAAASTTEKSGMSETDLDLVRKALGGIEMLNGRVEDVMSALAGRPVTAKATTPLELFKSADAATAAMSISQRIEEAVESDRLDAVGEARAYDLLQKSSAVREGAMSQDMWDSLYRQAPANVQEVFRAAA